MWRFSLLCAIILNMEDKNPALKAEQEQVVEEEKKENQPLPIFPRVAYTIIDFGMMAMAFIGLYQLALHTPVSTNLHQALSDMNDIQIEYGVSTGYFIKTYLQDGEKTNYKKYQDEGGIYYYQPDPQYENDYYIALNEDVTYKDLKFNYTVNSYVISGSCFMISELIFLFIIPITNKRRATLGIIFAGGQVISKKYVARAKWYQHLGRFFFVLIIDTLLPYFFIGEVALLVVPVLTILITLTNKERRTVHDLITGIKIVDKRTFVPLVDHDATDKEPDKVD